MPDFISRYASRPIDKLKIKYIDYDSFDKQKMLSEIFRVLKPGGEFYFSDVFTSRRIPQDLKDDPVLIGECIAGAFYTEFHQQNG